MDKIFEVKSTTGQIMNVYEDIETYTDFLIMWRGYRYSTAIVAGTHCAFLTMRGYNGI